MTALAWPAVAALAVTLGFIACILWLKRPAALEAKLDVLAKDFHAFTVAAEVKVKELEEGLKRAQALNEAVVGSRLPQGLRRAP